MRRLTVIQFQISDQLQSNPGAVAPLVPLEMPVECDLPVHPQPNKKNENISYKTSTVYLWLKYADDHYQHGSTDRLC